LSLFLQNIQLPSFLINTDCDDGDGDNNEDDDDDDSHCSNKIYN